MLYDLLMARRFTVWEFPQRTPRSGKFEGVEIVTIAPWGTG